MRRALFFLFNLSAYLVFLVNLGYAIGFLGNIGTTNSIDANPTMPMVPALLINGSMIFLFFVYRSIMAKPSFKRWWSRIIPLPIDRSTNILLMSSYFLLLMWQWQPIGGVIWEVSNQTAKYVLLIAYLIGWAIVLIGILLINPLDFFDIRKTWLSFRNRPQRNSTNSILLYYRFIRHSMYLGILIILWSTSVMTVAHLFFAMLAALFILTEIQLEERNLTVN